MSLNVKGIWYMRKSSGLGDSANSHFSSPVNYLWESKKENINFHKSLNTRNQKGSFSFLFLFFSFWSKNIKIKATDYQA